MSALQFRRILRNIRSWQRRAFIGNNHCRYFDGKPAEEENEDEYEIDEKLDEQRKEELNKRHSYHQNTASRLHQKHLKRMEFEEKINEQWRKQREDKRAKERNISNFTFYSTPNDHESKTHNNAIKYGMFGIAMISIGYFLMRKK